MDPVVDSAVEGDEAVTLSLVNGPGYTIGTSTGVTGTILDAVATVSSVSQSGICHRRRIGTPRLHIHPHGIHDDSADREFWRGRDCSI
jgi:hypothetical protein